MSKKPEPVKCKYCPVMVLFVRDAEGKLQVLDTRAPVYTVNDDGSFCARFHHGYVSHWATCSGRDLAKKAQQAKKDARRREWR